jgi:hypothetical protein
MRETRKSFNADENEFLYLAFLTAIFVGISLLPRLFAV